MEKAPTRAFTFKTQSKQYADAIIIRDGPVYKCLKCEFTKNSRCFQSGEGLSWGLLRDWEIFANLCLTFVWSSTVWRLEDGWCLDTKCKVHWCRWPPLLVPGGESISCRLTLLLSSVLILGLSSDTMHRRMQILTTLHTPSRQIT